MRRKKINKKIREKFNKTKYICVFIYILMHVFPVEKQKIFQFKIKLYPYKLNF